MICFYPCSITNKNAKTCRYCGKCQHLCSRFNSCRSLKRLSTSVKKHLKKLKWESKGPTLSD
jgi:hypothetical protein